MGSDEEAALRALFVASPSPAITVGTSVNFEEVDKWRVLYNNV